MVDFAGCLRGARLAEPNAAGPKLNPASPVVDAVMNERRLIAGENIGRFMVGVSDACVREVHQAKSEANLLVSPLILGVSPIAPPLPAR